ncbi:hypothetical protein [Pontibacter chinhatensis]|uniref:Uncharacterized protein n=1 Tax=Pontibacter chinhatensis TaxID=1436961 RepID=A0A1I2ZTF7_9BACT|nr:hypothetical protein [Pontibacter chinhatensis]SFH40915.1 hypothetical protein SAMN05421739_11829 [Pontibacter chinhatensis]
MVSKALKFGMILLRATLMAVYHILAAIFGWDKKDVSQRQRNTQRQYGKQNLHPGHDLTDANRHGSQADSKTKGDRFEGYIIKKVNQEYFKIREWRSDKYIDGRYAESNMLPDLELEYIHKSAKSLLAIECKYRSSLIGGAVEIAKPYQLDNYRRYSDERGVPVFIALGLGGYADDPDEEFIIPLENIGSNIISYEELRRFRRRSRGDLFYDCHSQELR